MVSDSIWGPLFSSQTVTTISDRTLRRPAPVSSDLGNLRSKYLDVKVLMRFTFGSSLEC
jgi:hypothetical protein